MNRKWFEERCLRMAYWLLARCQHESHSAGYSERVSDAQREIAGIITVFYGPLLSRSKRTCAPRGR